MPYPDGQGGGPADPGAGRRRLIDDEALDGHRVRRQQHRFQAQPGGAGSVLARAGEPPARDPPRPAPSTRRRRSCPARAASSSPGRPSGSCPRRRRAAARGCRTASTPGWGPTRTPAVTRKDRRPGRAAASRGRSRSGRRAAQPHRLPGHRHDILDRDRHARQRQVLPVGPRVHLGGLPGRLRRPDPDERAKLRVEPGDPVQMPGDHLGRRDLPGPDRRRDLPGGTPDPSSHEHIMAPARRRYQPLSAPQSTPNRS